MFEPNTPQVHMISAGLAGFITGTVSNPLSLIRTRLQLNSGPLSTLECTKRIFQREGMKGYFKVCI